MGATPGWLLAANAIHRGDDLELHRLPGVAVMVRVAPLRRQDRLLLISVVLAVLVGITAHTGRSLTFGPTWLGWPR